MRTCRSAAPDRWMAANYSQLYGMTLDEGIRYRLGTQRPSRTIMNMNEIQVAVQRGKREGGETVAPLFSTFDLSL